MKEKSTSSICAANIYNYLKDIKNNNKEFRLIRKELEQFIASNIKYADDTGVINVLTDFGWSSTLSRFTSDDVDLEGLRIALSKKSLKLGSRASQVAGEKANSKSYVPEMLLSHLSRILKKTKPIIEAESFNFPGVCLLCDISGFTRLSGDYCNLGKNGIDGLQKATNGYMGRLVDTIYSYGGDIIKFAGDAIICVFLSKSVKDNIMNHGDGSTPPSSSGAGGTTSGRSDESDGTLDLMAITKVANPGSNDSAIETPTLASEAMPVVDSETGMKSDELITNTISSSKLSSSKNKHPLFELCISAMMCAMDLREISTDLLTVHVAISCGDMCFGVLGGVQDKWECLISGECLVQLSQCLDDAPSRNVAITKQVADIIGNSWLDNFGAEGMPSSNYLLHQKAERSEHKGQGDEEEGTALCQMCKKEELMDLVDKFVPYPVLVGVRGSELNLLAEIREVTTMFLKFDSYNPDTHKDLTSLQQHFYAAQSILLEVGAFIRQFLVDDKGCVLIACWGVPTASYLNNALRALRASFLIKHSLNKLNMEVSIGVTTGNVYCGNVGSEVRREYAAIGDVVNLSARLMSKAKHGILMDEATFKRLDFELVKSCKPLEPMMVKGKPYPIQAYAFIGDNAPSLKENTKEELEIRPMCRIELTKILEDLSPQTNKTLLSTFAISLRDANITPAMKVVLLEGKVGTGKGTAAKWFVKEATSREYKVVHIIADPKDTMLEYRLLLKLLKAFLGDEVADNPNHMKMVVMHLLKAIYAGDRNTIDKIAVPAVRVAFGLNLQQGGPAAVPSGASTGGNANGGASGNVTIRGGHSILPAGKVPPWMITETIRDIFSFLMNEQPTVIIIENVQFSDEASLKSFLVIQEIKCRAIMMITMLAPEDYAEYAAIKNSSAIFSVGGSITASSVQTEKASVEWLETYRHIVIQSASTYHLKLGDFNVSEIDAMIRAGLNTDKIPLGLCDYVLQISGGSIFWINTIIDFMKTTSPQEFMNMTSDEGFLNHNISTTITNIPPSTNTVDSRRVGPSFGTAGSGTSSGSLLNKPTKPNRGQLFASFSIANMNEGQDALTILKQQESSRALISSGQTTVSAPGQTTVATDGVQSSVFSGYNSNLNKSRLDQFIVVRFERLPLDYQKILKAASVIGYEFSRYVLYGILSNALKATMYAALKNLMKEHWICKPENSEADYVFNHPLIYDIIYDLTPSSDRTALHKSIAEYYESVNFDDPKFFGEMSRHFAYCNTMKAFEYAVKKADYSIVEVGDLELACMILNESLKFVSNSIDAEVVLVVLDRARDLFAESDCDDAENLSMPESTKSKQGLHAGKLRRHNSKMRRKASQAQIQNDTAKWTIFFCCSSTSGVIANNAVAPESSVRSAVSHHSAVSGSHKSSRSFANNTTSYTDKGKGLIARLIHRIDRKVNQLLQMYNEQGKVGRPLPWQVPFLNTDDDDDDPLMVEEGMSSRSKMSWTYRVPTRLRK